MYLTTHRLVAHVYGMLQDKAADRKKKLQDQAERLQFDDQAKELVGAHI